MVGSAEGMGEGSRDGAELMEGAADGAHDFLREEAHFSTGIGGEGGDGGGEGGDGGGGTTTSITTGGGETVGSAMLGLRKITWSFLRLPLLFRLPPRCAATS